MPARCVTDVPRLLTVAIVIMGLALLGAAVPAHAKDEIRLGFSMSLTGIYAQGAPSQINTYKLWEKEVNARGGIMVQSEGKKLPVKLVFYDDQSQSEVAVRIYEKLITDDKVDFLLPPFGTTLHFAVAGVAEKYKMPMIGNTASSFKLRELKTKYVWFISANPSTIMPTLVDLLQHLKVKTVGILYVQDAFARECLQFFEPAAKKAKLDLVMVKDYPIGVRDLTPLLVEAKGKAPQAVIMFSYPADSFLGAKQIQEAGLNPPFFFQLVGPAIAAYGQAFAKSAEGITTFGFWSAKGAWPGAREFSERYQAEYKEKPDYLDSSLTYVSLQILQQAIEKAGTLDREKVRAMIQNETFQTIQGPVKFTGLENKVTPPAILQHQKGELEIVWPPKVQTAKPLYPKPTWP